MVTSVKPRSLAMLAKLLAAPVELPNQSPQTVTASEAAPAGECLIHVTESLGPAKQRGAA
jgi:hypothetical protein